MSYNNTDKVILVDKDDNEIGTANKLPVHEMAYLHRAFSIFIFNSNNKLMLHQRAKSKYHCGGMWTNTCCSHPRSGEKTIDAAHRRLVEEMGFDCVIEEKFKFYYKSSFENGLTEHEIDHVFTGIFNDDPKINLDEVESFKWVSLLELKKDIEKNPHIYTPWFKIALKKLEEFGF